MNYMHVWGCPAEAKIFSPNARKLDARTVSCHFIGYPDKSKGFRFYCPNQLTKFVETRHAVFLEDEMLRGSMTPREINLEEKRVYVPTPMIQEPVLPVHDNVVPPVENTADTTPADIIPNEINEEDIQQAPAEENKHDGEPLRRSHRVRMSAISSNYVTYMSEDMDELVLDDDPTSFKEAMKSEHSSEWYNAMKDEMKSMSTNDV